MYKLKKPKALVGASIALFGVWLIADRLLWLRDELATGTPLEAVAFAFIIDMVMLGTITAMGTIFLVYALRD